MNQLVLSLINRYQKTTCLWGYKINNKAGAGAVTVWVAGSWPNHR
ncbi:hypothetical protein ACFFGT_01975 [Mucilaginibacter angelicae]|uniref:Uncharacterized protein n=1 Tax=Mucilaginibacter angelicae TaxID=869718 RepID=A0ABV6KZN6_9SPHI